MAQVLKVLDSTNMGPLLSALGPAHFLPALSELHVGDSGDDPFLLRALVGLLEGGGLPALETLYLHASSPARWVGGNVDPSSRDSACSRLAGCLCSQPGQRRLRAIRFCMIHPSPTAVRELEAAARVCSPVTFEGVYPKPRARGYHRTLKEEFLRDCPGELFR
jgi:hypothetical protein